MRPYTPRGLRVFWDNGRYVALWEPDRNHGRLPFNLAGYNAQTKREAILAAREALGYDNYVYVDLHI